MRFTITVPIEDQELLRSITQSDPKLSHVKHPHGNQPGSVTAPPGHRFEGVKLTFSPVAGSSGIECEFDETKVTGLPPTGAEVQHLLQGEVDTILKATKAPKRQ